MGLVFVLSTTFAYHSSKCSMLNEHPCAQVPLDYTGYAPEQAQ